MTKEHRAVSLKLKLLITAFVVLLCTCQGLMIANLLS